jgi:hypothetical protein
MTTNKIEKLAEILIEKKGLHMPINMIDGVRVNCFMSLDYIKSIKRWDVSVSGTNPFSYREEEDCILKETAWKENRLEEELNIKDVTEMITELVQLVGNLKYDKLYGLRPAGKWECQYLIREVFDLPNVELKFKNNICCVCHDMTRDKTNCEHDLCLQCLAKMPYTEPPDHKGYEEGQKGKSCPICRDWMMEHL